MAKYNQQQKDVDNQAIKAAARYSLNCCVKDVIIDLWRLLFNKAEQYNHLINIINYRLHCI